MQNFRNYYASFQSSVYAIYFLLITLLKFMVDPLQAATSICYSEDTAARKWTRKRDFVILLF